MILGVAMFCAQCSMFETSCRPKPKSLLPGETHYLGGHTEHEKAEPSIARQTSTQSASTEGLVPGKAGYKSIEESITTKKRLTYAKPEGAGRLTVDFGLGELVLDLDLMIRLFDSDNTVTRLLKEASKADKTIRTSFVGTKGDKDEDCVITSLRMVSPDSPGPLNEGLYYTIWDYLDHGANLVACRMSSGQDNPSVDIARFKRRYPADPGLYDDGQALLIDGKVIAARIIGHACRE
jgi:hypothetical protein